MTALDDAKKAVREHAYYSGPLARTSDWNQAAHDAIPALRALIREHEALLAQVASA